LYRCSFSRSRRNALRDFTPSRSFDLAMHNSAVQACHGCETP
jgi:hypothetical protein